MQLASVLYVAIPAFCETGSHAAYCRQAHNADARRWVRSSRDHDGQNLARFESDKAGYVKAPALIVSKLLSGSTHREDTNFVSIVFLKTTPRERTSRRSKIDDRESRILTTFPPHYSFMLNALTFSMRIKNLISRFRRYTLLPIKCDLLSIIYLEINRWTNFYNKFYILKVFYFL